ncbi:MAG: hypothetical protein RLZZ127_2101, partial [Planctomycetota bacterium]
EQTDYPALELLLVDNQSKDPRTLAVLERAAADPRVRVLPHDAPFNYSAINNRAAAQARGDLIALVNDDIEMTDPGWLREMVSLAIRPEIGCVGAKLLYPDGTLQHAGVVTGLGGVAGHSHKYMPADTPGYFRRLAMVHEVSAVTAACLVVRRSVFEQVKGLDEANLSVAFNDVDFCLRVREAGYRNLWTPWAELIHHESKSRGADTQGGKLRRFQRELAYMQRRWDGILDRDPFYSPNLTLGSEDFAVRKPDERLTWSHP